MADHCAMIPPTLRKIRALFMGMLVVVCLVLAFFTFFPSLPRLGVQAAPHMTQGQMAAIQGAYNQLLLPPVNEQVYLPMVRR